MTDSEELMYEDKPVDGADNDALSILAQLGDAVGPDSATIDSQGQLPPDADFLAKVLDYRIEATEGGPRFTINAEVISEGAAGRRLPFISGILDPNPTEKGGRRDFALWDLADAALTKAGRQAIQKSNTVYRKQVVAILEALKGKTFGARTGMRTSKKNGQDYLNVVRVYAPKGIAPKTTLTVEE